MTFRPLIDPWVVVVFVALGVALCVIGAGRRSPSSPWVLVRRLTMVGVVALMLVFVLLGFDGARRTASAPGVTPSP